MAQRPLIVDHASTDLSKVPDSWLQRATSTLKVTCGHISHGSQLVTGIAAFRGSEGSPYYYSSSLGAP
jgi:hypothetical protein